MKREKRYWCKKDVAVLINEKVGEIKAQIIERNNEIWMIQGLSGPMVH